MSETTPLAATDSPSAQISASRGNTSTLPPAMYWTELAQAGFLDVQVAAMQGWSDRRVTEFFPETLPPPKDAALELLEKIAADGWLTPVQRSACANCKVSLTNEQVAEPVCPNCGEAFNQHGSILVQKVFVRNLALSRDVDWVIAIHGMNTSGAWQEAFSWRLGTTWGRSVPVAVYKYGIVVPGVLMPWRRRTLQRELREKIAALQREAKIQGFNGRPDVIAHSFGTWLFAHLLVDELDRASAERLKFGRLILAGCVVRPDFNWQKLKESDLIEEVLNHFGSADAIVPLAHATIWDSGPSGRRGFDDHSVLNIRAAGYGHSDLFSIEKCVLNGKGFAACADGGDALTHLQHAYQTVWKPFLTLPPEEFGHIPNKANPAETWRPLPWLLRGTIFSIAVLPLCVAVLILVMAFVTEALGEVHHVAMRVTAICGSIIGLLLFGTLLARLWQRFRYLMLTAFLIVVIGYLVYFATAARSLI